MERRFCQVDVFAEERYFGNPVAVVLDGKGLTTEEMQQFASWTNLSETTYVVPPEAAGADYRVRIFTPSRELPFAGHPTLGTCHAWLGAGGTPQRPDVIIQECDAGLIELRRIDGALAFAAPPLLRSGPVDEQTLERVVAALGIARAEVIDAQWVDNGPGGWACCWKVPTRCWRCGLAWPISTSGWRGRTRRVHRWRSRSAPSPRRWAGSVRIR
jgi:PhzF family phenazine biosynthesis protein